MSTTLSPAAPVTRSNTMTPFQEEIEGILALAAHLNRCRVNDDKEGFCSALNSAGVNGTIDGVPSDEFLWPRLPTKLATPTPQKIAATKKTSELPSVLGIELDSTDVPRAAMLYKLMNARLGDMLGIEFTTGTHAGGKEGRTSNAHRVTMIDLRTGEHPKDRLIKYFQGLEPTNLISRRVEGKSAPLVETLGADMGLQLGQLLFELQMEFPTLPNAKLLASVLQRGLAGEEVVIAGAFCPDYAFEETGDPNQPYRYTFDSLGEGVGLVAQQFVRVLPRLLEFFQNRDMNVRAVLDIGDFEANSTDTLNRVKVDKTEFHRRCRSSVTAVRAQLDELLGNNAKLVEVGMYEVRVGAERLALAQAHCAEMLARRDFGLMSNVYSDPEALLLQIANDGAKFYRRWYSAELTDAEVIDRVIGQGSEYGAMAYLDRQLHGNNVIVLSGDRPQMHSFDQLRVNVPVFAVKRCY